MDEMKCEWSGVKNVARTGIPFIKLDRIKVILYKHNRWIWIHILVQISKRLTAVLPDLARLGLIKTYCMCSHGIFIVFFKLYFEKS